MALHHPPVTWAPLLLLVAITQAFLTQPPPHQGHTSAHHLTCFSTSPSTYREGASPLSPLFGKPPANPHTAVPVAKPGTELTSLKVNQQLCGAVIGIYTPQKKGGTAKAFVDVGVTRVGRGGKWYPVFAMLPLRGRYRKKIKEVGQQVKVYVSQVMADSGRLTALLHPVYRLPKVDPAGVPYPTYELSELKTGVPLVGVVTGKTKTFAFLDVGVYQRRGKFQLKNTIPGGLHRLDMLERFALGMEFKGPLTEAMVEDGMTMKVYVKSVDPRLGRLELTCDEAITPEKAANLKESRAKMLMDVRTKQPIEDLELGDVRKGIITKVVPKGVKVGIGAVKTGFVPIGSIADALGKQINKLDELVAVGGRMRVEIDEITKDKKLILKCLKILEQPKKDKDKTVKKGKGKKAPSSTSFSETMSLYEDEGW